jgi:hypothetical protein
VLFLIANVHSIVEIRCVVNIVHHVTFPFYGKYYPYLYIVLQVEILLEVKSQWLQGFNENFFISGMFILLKPYMLRDVILRFGSMCIHDDEGKISHNGVGFSLD